jgi:hypothetical protein
MERHYYGFLPVHPLLLAATFRLAGLGLLQARIEVVVLGFAVLLLTYGLGRRLFGPRVAELALLFLLVVRLTGLTRYQVSGIPFLDLARIARYDMAVPVFGLAALHLFHSASQHNGRLPILLTGIMTGLAGLSHLYGLFWLPLLVVLAVWNKLTRRQLAALILGFLLPWLAYFAYVTGGFEDWLGQTQLYAARFDLTSPSWYLANLLRELRRYGPGLGPPSWSYLLRPGFWSALIFVPAAAISLAVRTRRYTDRAARMVLVPLVGFPALFALLLHLKLVNYTLTVLPIGALAAAWGATSAYRWAGTHRHRILLRSGLLAVLLVVCLEGASRIAVLQSAGARTTPYAHFIQQVGGGIEPGMRVLGLHNYWFGMQHTEYRSWAVPLLLADQANIPAPVPVSDSLMSFDPEVILIDVRMRTHLDQNAVPGSPAAEALAWMEARGYLLARVVEDPTYGRMEIYRRGH